MWRKETKKANNANSMCSHPQRRPGERNQPYGNHRHGKGKLFPTDTGTVVNDFLTEFFPDILDYNFTATVEKEFDEIAEGEVKWTSILKELHSIPPFGRKDTGHKDNA